MTGKRRRVAITGLGLVTPAGNSAAKTWSTLLEGRSRISTITRFDASGFPVRIAGEVREFDESTAVAERKLLKFANRSHRFALAAAEEAIRDAGIRPSAETSRRWGCTVGTGMMGMDFADLIRLHRHSAAAGELDARHLLDDEAALDPMIFCRSQTQAGMSLLLRHFGIRGYGTSVHTACASGGQAVGTGMKLIRRGTADWVLAGGFDSMITPIGLAGFCLLNALSTDNETPERASRPFDATRNGFVLGEGAGFLVLEEWEAARRRGARIYAELAGDGNSLSSYRITDSHPSGDGPVQSMQQALADAGASPAEVDYINAHGTSTLMNDRSEAAAVRAVFGSNVQRVAVSSTKSVMGHLIAAAGAVEAAICALAIHHGALPVNANLRELDAECELDIVRGQPRRHRINVAISNSLGFGGSNSCLVLRNPEDVDLRVGAGTRDHSSHVSRATARSAKSVARKLNVVITGAGALCAAGRHPDEIWGAICAGRSALSPVRQWDTAGWPRRVAGEIADFDPVALLKDRKIQKFIRRSDVFGLYAAEQAIEASGLTAYRDTLGQTLAAEYSERTGVYVGSGGGSYQSQYDYFPLLTAADANLHTFGRKLNATVNPLWLLRTLPNNVPCHVGIRHGLKGANACITNHSVSGVLAIVEATEALRQGEADRAVAIGHDSPIEPQAMLYFHQLGLVAQDTIRPFDRRRDGSLLGEGAAALVLETAASSAQRGATKLGEVLGHGYTCDGEGLLAVRDDGAALSDAIRIALDDAQLVPSDIGLIVAHANGTPQSDVSEAAAILRVFGADMPPVTGFKWAFGHLLAASGIIEAVQALWALRERKCPGIATLGELDPAVAGLRVSRAPCTPRSDVALALSRGFAGTNAALILRAAGRC